MNISRRTLLTAAAAAPFAAYAGRLSAATQLPIGIGVQTYSFRDMLQTPGDMVDKMIAGMKALGLKSVELFEASIQPPALNEFAAWAVPPGGTATHASVYGAPPLGKAPSKWDAESRAGIRRWRLDTPMSYFTDVRRRFNSAGIEIFAFNFAIRDADDEELQRGFAMTHTLGTGIMTGSTTISNARRIKPMVEKSGLIVGLHGHSNKENPDELSTARSFETCLAMSPNYRVNLDLGHMTAVDADPIAFIRKHHARITNIHIKDRERHEGPNRPFGQGDTPIREVLQLLVRNRYAISVDLEYEYAGQEGSVRELMKCVAYVRQAIVQA